jgi:hypothetical protein
LSLGSSAYQLPHYIFVVFPLAAIITAKLLRDFFEKKYRKTYKVMYWVQIFLVALLFGACLILLTYVFPSGAVSIALWIISLVIWLFIAFKNELKGKMLWLSAAGMILVNLFLNNYVYVQLLQYEAGPQIGRYISEQHIDANNVIIYKPQDPMNAVHFYAQHVIGHTDDSAALAGKQYIITMNKGLAELKQKGYSIEIIKQGDYFAVSQLTSEFLNPATRSKEVHQYYILKIKNPS